MIEMGGRNMRIRSAICAFLILALLCAPFQAGADTLILPTNLKVINSMAYAGLKKDKVVFPDDIEYIADDAFQDAEFVGTGKADSYAYHWCVSHGFPWTSKDTAKTTSGKVVDKEVNYSGRTIWQRYVQKHFLKATVRNNKGDADTNFNWAKAKYNIRMSLHIEEIYDIASIPSRLNSIEIMLKGWDGPDEDDNNYESFEKDTAGYTTVFRADWVKGKAYNVPKLMYDERGNVMQYYDEKAKEMKNRYEHLDLRPEVWEGAVISVDTKNRTVSIYHPGDLIRDYHTYSLDEKSSIDGKAHCDVTPKTSSETIKNLIIDKNGKPYKKLRIKITASFNNTCRIALDESVIDNVFVNVVGSNK